MTDLSKYRLELSELATQLLKINSKVTSVLEMIERDMNGSGNSAISVDVNEDKIDNIQIELEDIRKIILSRKKRHQYFSEEMFFDPAWDIILYVMERHINGDLTTVSRIYKDTHIPYTTVVRWVGAFEDRGLLLKKSDPGDGRRIFLRPSKLMIQNFSSWFEKRYSD